jgi:hypothetical protein
MGGGVQRHQQGEERDESHIEFIVAWGARLCSIENPSAAQTQRADWRLLAVTQITRPYGDTIRGTQRVATDPERARSAAWSSCRLASRVSF